ncbi:hypothetical protein [Glutamicibacter endophyticus]
MSAVRMQQLRLGSVSDRARLRLALKEPPGVGLSSYFQPASSDEFAP